jgi:hypothetical protein
MLHYKSIHTYLHDTYIEYVHSTFMFRNAHIYTCVFIYVYTSSCHFSVSSFSLQFRVVFLQTETEVVQYFLSEDLYVMLSIYCPQCLQYSPLLLPERFLTMLANLLRLCSKTTLTGESWFHISPPRGFEPVSLVAGSKQVVHWTSETW